MRLNGDSGSKRLLVTGGAGFIGSHTVLELLNAGFEVTVIDNCANAYQDDAGSMPESLVRVQKLASKSIQYHNIDITDLKSLRELFSKETFCCVIHFAGLKAVGESISIPLLYYNVNLVGAINLMNCMEEFNCKNMIFSSSATVYGTPEFLPLTENHPIGNCTNTYGRTKVFIEHILMDYAKANSDYNVVILRYFNPIGAHESGEIGEDPKGVPNNLMPFVAQVASGKLSELKVFGEDYKTVDGTGVRDYIHVVDLALGHLAAVKKLVAGSISGQKIYNLGTGVGYSVLQMVKAMEKASEVTIPYKICPRRDGDVGEVYSDVSLAEKELGWRAERDLDTMCIDLWRWQNKNKNGYKPASD